MSGIVGKEKERRSKEEEKERTGTTIDWLAGFDKLWLSLGLGKGCCLEARK